MQIPLTVKHDDGTIHNVTTAPIDILMLEDAYGVSAPHVFEGKSDKLTMVKAQMWLAWHACKRMRYTSEGDFYAWVASCAEISSTPEEVAVPLDLAPITG